MENESKSDTPETDEFERATCWGNESSLEFARGLERERDMLAKFLAGESRDAMAIAERLIRIEDAARKLVKAKGRYNTKFAYAALETALSSENVRALAQPGQENLTEGN